jgi:hypothetical protein
VDSFNILLPDLSKGFNLFKGGQPLMHEVSPQKFPAVNLKCFFARPPNIVLNMLCTFRKIGGTVLLNLPIQ